MLSSILRKAFKCKLQFLPSDTYSHVYLTRIRTRLLSPVQGNNFEFYSHGSVHRESTLECSNKMPLFVQYFIPCKQLYMFRVKHSHIIRSSSKMSLQHLVVTNSMWPSVVVDESHTVCHYQTVVYIGIFSWGGQQIQLITEHRERGCGGGSPLVRGSGGSCNFVQEISFHIVNFS
jgi:hypothetical protein